MKKATGVVVLAILLFPGCSGLDQVFERDAVEDVEDSAVDLDSAVRDSANEDLITDSAGDTLQVDTPLADTDVDGRDPDVATITDSPEVVESPGAGTWDDPIRITEFPYTHTGNTSESTTREVDNYSCAPSTNESGPEIVYQIDADVSGIISVSVDDVSGDSIDADVHILDQERDCLVRDNVTASQLVESSRGIFVVVDTWVNGANEELVGPYTIAVTILPLPSGNCEMTYEGLEMYNRDEPLQLPALGPVVMEAHLVTTEEFPDGWPTSSRDGLAAHYALSEALTGFEVDRHEPWAPEGEGGSEWGQGSTRRPPVLDEAWYVNMYWRHRPDHGTRMLVYNPANGLAVVASAGYETGPGDPTRIGGAVEEVHHHLGSRHLSPLVMGFLLDQDLELGPIQCD